MSDALADRFLGSDARQRVEVTVATLVEQFGRRISVSQSVREQHGRGEAIDAGRPPDAVVWPESSAEVAAIVSLCARHVVPVIAYGAGTSLEGHVSAPYGGICIDLSRMSQVIAVRSEDADCTVQPGVLRTDLNSYLRDTGLFFPVDPGANATIGGMVSTRASGTTTVRYGAMSENVKALEAVVADGRILRFGTRARKSAAGYDLVHLLTGSEGTLGVITEITLKLHARPQSVTCATCAFPSLRAAVETVEQVMYLSTGIARIEFLDEVQVRACNRYSNLDLEESPTLCMEFHGSPVSVAEQTELVREVATGNGAAGYACAAGREERATLWRARHNAYFAALALRPGCSAFVSDVCVPMSALADCVAETRRDIDREGLLAPIVGHVGDGNFHVVFLLDPESTSERMRANRVYDTMIDRAIAAQGTCTGEHGIGLGKRKNLAVEVGPEVVGLMREIKRTWDPAGILNPGKVFLDEDGSR